MKVYLRGQNRFFPETVEFYKSFTEIVPIEDAEIIVINDFDEIETSKIVACNSTGLDHIKAKEIISLRGEDLADFTAVPELCLAMAISLLRHQHMELRGKTVGVVGYGRIGRRFAEYCKALGAKVLSFDKGEPVQNLYNILEEADIVSLHITADEENRGWFGKEEFEKMKDGAVFLNSSRPWLVNEEALKWALNEKLSLAWFDFDMPFSHDDLITTAHYGGTTIESKKRSEMIIAEKIKKLYGQSTR